MTPPRSETEVVKLLRRCSVADIETLFDVLGTRSRMTVFRRLKAVGYRSSFTHAGGYYTLADIPQFDDLGLWFWGDVGFSRVGTLRDTAAVLVDAAATGRTHAELSTMLRVRVQNALLDLVRTRRIGREAVAGVQVYVCADPERAGQQIARRREQAVSHPADGRVPTDEETLAVLIEALRAAPVVPAPEVVAERLRARGLSIAPQHVAQVLLAHGIAPGKKTPE